MPRENIITLKSGREIHANQGILGIDAGAGVSGGYDQGIYITKPGECVFDDDNWTAIEVHELADIAITRWLLLKQQWPLPAIPLPT